MLDLPSEIIVQGTYGNGLYVPILQRLHLSACGLAVLICAGAETYARQPPQRRCLPTVCTGCVAVAVAPGVCVSDV